MDQKWHILFCDGNMRTCPVEIFIENCAPKHQVKILRFLNLLEEHGPTLPRPYADLLYDGVHELRVRLSGDHIRILYFFCHRKFIILYHAFVKTTGPVPDKIIQNVIVYRQEFMENITQAELEKIACENI